MEDARPPGIDQVVHRIFRQHPLAFPAVFIVVGGALLLLQATQFHHVVSNWAGVVSVLILVVGILMLPFGIWDFINRYRHAMTLQCPNCYTFSRQARKPFPVRRFDDVEYAVVTCTECHHTFEADPYVKLI